MTNKEQEKNLLNHLIDLGKKSAKLPPLSKTEEKIIETDSRFKSVYFSNKLEGSRLTKEEAVNAILSDN
jgi:hypothetical protein